MNNVTTAGGHVLDRVFGRLGSQELLVCRERPLCCNRQFARGLAGAVFLLSGCDAQKDECSRPDEYWCNGKVVESCHEQESHNTIVFVYDCDVLDAQCEEHEGEADCVFADLSCSDRPAQSCEDGRQVLCRDGWSSPSPADDCEGLGQSFCVETYLGTAGCSDVPESCSPDTPQAMCYEERRFVCSQGFWERATSSEGTMCTEPTAKQ
jgi:hypothetical protein